VNVSPPVVFDPVEFVTFRVTVYVPFATYVWLPGFWTLDVVPSPHVQNQLPIAQFGEVDLSTTASVSGAWRLVRSLGLEVKPALGSVQIADVGVGVGVGEPVGVGVGVLSANDELGAGGSVSICAVDTALKVILREPPKKTAMTGVSRVK
jgi:hypothetical protein